ncbi:MFS transporter [Actinocatenispora rupis]|uniref:Major facilitator superfamily (MFS) profile domain-containing protein n=1 Tax=Actinocatenispora rupis TaxID=519421 RepID=A0A8J3JGJ7_9ACTN|nr:MFS transporter [Actinocatenispora rupis]GID14478.1 hypothetical protein Aru02nite_53670 [Actinocatenispora rupis]
MVTVAAPPTVTPVRRLWVAVLCGYLALGGTLQILPAAVVTRFGAGPATVGLVVGAAFAATAVLRPIAGRAGDAGRSRAAMLTGAALTALGAAGHLAAPNVPVLLAARLVMGFGEAALFSGGLPWVLAGVRPDRRGRVTGWFGLSMWSGLAAGPVLAALVDRLAGPAYAWGLVAALPVVSAVLVATTRRPAAPPEPTPLLPRTRRDVVPAGAALPGLLLGLAAYGYGTLSALLVLYLARIGGAGAGLAVFAAAFLAARAAGSPWVDRLGPLRVLRTVLVVEAAGLALLAAAGSPAVALTAVAVAGLGLGLVYPAASALTLGRTSGRPGAAVGAMTSFWDLGILAAGPVGGLVATRAGYPAAFAVAAVAALGCLTVTYALARSR